MLQICHMLHLAVSKHIHVIIPSFSSSKKLCSDKQLQLLCGTLEMKMRPSHLQDGS